MTKDCEDENTLHVRCVIDAVVVGRRGGRGASRSSLQSINRATDTLENVMDLGWKYEYKQASERSDQSLFFVLSAVRLHHALMSL